MAEWRSIPGFTDYEASDEGEIRRCRKTTAGRGRVGHILRPSVSGRYKHVTLTNASGEHCVSVHRLVLLTFEGPSPTPRHEGAHGDGNSHNNRRDNLRWALPEQNVDDKRRHGTHVCREKHPCAILTAAAVAEIRAAYAAVARDAAGRVPWGFRRDLARRFGVVPRTVEYAANERTWR